MSDSSDTDGFGEFTEAIVSGDSPPISSNLSPNLKPALSSSDMNKDDLFGNFDDAVVSSEAAAVEYFSKFDVGRYSEDLPQPYLDSLKLWSKSCFVEDTAALKFEWSKSKLSKGMVSALNMNTPTTPTTLQEEDTPQMHIPYSPLLPLELPPPETRFMPKK